MHLSIVDVLYDLKHPYQNYYGETHVRRFSLPALEPFDEDHMREMSLLFANDAVEADVAKQLQNVKLACKAFYCAVFMALKSDNPKHVYKIYWSQLVETAVWWDARFPAHDGSYCFRQMRKRPVTRLISERSLREEYNQSPYALPLRDRGTQRTRRAGSLASLAPNPNPNFLTLPL
jgi:hypothetical protein